MPGLVSRHDKELYEDWTDGTNIGTSATSAGIKWLNSSDTGNTAFVHKVDAEGMVAEAATDATDDDMCEIAHHYLTWSVQNGKLELETRCRITVGAVASVAISVGFNDDELEDSNTLPAELATATWTSNAAAFAGVVFDPDATNANFHAFWVDDDNDSTEALADLRMTGLAPVLDKWFGVKIVLTDRGSGKGALGEFTVVEESTGRMVQKRFNTNLDRDVLLTPHIAFENRAGVAHTFQIDYIHVKQSRSQVA